MSTPKNSMEKYVLESIKSLEKAHNRGYLLYASTYREKYENKLTID